MHCKLIRDLDSNACASLQDRGFQSGDGLFETLLMEQNRIRFWPEHYQRLQRSASRLKISCPPRDWLEQQLQPYYQLDQRLIIKIILTRGIGGRGVQLPDGHSPNCYLLHYDAENVQSNQQITATFSDVTLPNQSQLAGIKHLSRLHYVLAAEALTDQPGVGDAILSDSSGHVVEGIVHNLFFLKNQAIHTPDLGNCGVAGVMRGLLLKKLKTMKKIVKIGYFTAADLLQSDECFLCNSVQGIRPIVAIDNKDFAVGPVTREIQQMMFPDESH